MTTIKGQNLRILLNEVPSLARPSCIAASTACTVHLALQLVEDTTKDTENGFISQVPVGINFDIRVDALVVNDESGFTADDLIVGNLYRLSFSRTGGNQNREAIESNVDMTGYAILNDIQLNAQNGDLSTYSAQFTGTGPLEKD